MIFIMISTIPSAISCSGPISDEQKYPSHTAISNAEIQTASSNKGQTSPNSPSSTIARVIEPTPIPTHTPNTVTKPSPIAENSQPSELEALFIYSRAIHALRIKEYDEAIKRFNQVVKRMPDLAIGYKGRGAAYYYLGKIDFALEDLNKSIELDHDLGGTYLYLGMIYRDQGNLDRAKSELKKAIALIHPIRERWELLIAEQTLSDLKTQ